MKDELKKYLSSLFRGAPATPRNNALYEELLGNLYDYYDEQIAAGTDERTAYNAAIRRLGDIQPLLEGVSSEYTDVPKGDPLPTLDTDELRRRKHVRGVGFATGVALFILSVVPPMFNGWLAFLMFAIVGIGVAIVILTHTRYPRFHDNSAAVYDPALSERANSRSNLLLAAGVLCCVVCVTPPMLLGGSLGSALMFALVALGVWMMVYAAHTRPHGEKRQTVATPTSGGYSWDGSATTEGHAPVRKKRKAWKVVLVIVVVAVLLGSLGIMIAAVADNQNLLWYHSGNAEICTNVGNAQITESVTGLDIDWLNGSVTVEVYDGDTAEISESQNGSAVESEKNQVNWGIRNGKLYIVHFAPKRIPVLYRKRESTKDLVVKLPRTMAEAMQTVRVTTVGASVTFGDMHTVNCNVDTVSGKVKIGSIVTENLKIDTVSGDVTVTGQIKRVDLNGVSAEFFLRSECEVQSLDADNVSGNIRLELPAGCKDLDVDTVSGNITVIVTSEGGFRLDFDTVSGRLITALPITADGKKYVFGDGSAIFDVETVSGDLTIQ